MASVFVALRSWRWALDMARAVEGLPWSRDPPPLPTPPSGSLSFARRRPGRWNENENLVVVFVVVDVVAWPSFDGAPCGPLSTGAELFWQK